MGEFVGEFTQGRDVYLKGYSTYFENRRRVGGGPE